MAKTRVLVVDDAVVIRRIVSELVAADQELELAGWASNGRLALARIPQINPDCITLDVEMPEMDGIQTLVEIRKAYPRLPVIMFSTLTEKGAAKTLEALARGATDYVTKPANVGSVTECLSRLRDDLIPKIKAYTRPKTLHVPPGIQRKPLVVRTDSKPCGIVCIASSTGGPNALTALLPALPGNLGVPVVIVQHMPPVFTNLFAKRLDELSSLRVEEGSEGRDVQPGRVYIAPGGKHMEVVKRGTRMALRLTEDPPENSCRPAADVLFRSAVQQYGPAVLGVVLTGMGSDGLRGSHSIVDAGGHVLAQDQESSVVWGMPGSVSMAGLPDRILPLRELAPAIAASVAKGCPVGHAL